MPKAGINHFFNPTKFGAPGIFGVIEASIHVRTQVAEARVVNKNPHEYGDRGNSDRKGDWNGLIGHRCHQNTLSKGILAR